MQIFKVKLRLKDVLRYNYLEKPSLLPKDVHYPGIMTYFIYGHGATAYMSHVIDYYPNFQQVSFIFHTAK